MGKQKRLDINWYAGVEDIITYDIPGDQSQRVHSFVIKADKNDTSNRLVQKTSTLGQITAVYSPISLKTTITINLSKEDTFDLGGKTYYWDHRCDSATDSSDTKVPIRGNFVIEAAVQTPFDGTNLPSEATRFIPLLDIITDGYVPRRNFSNPDYFDSILVYEKREIDTQQASLQQYINSEATNRTTADTTLQNNIDTEASVRTNVDTAESQARVAADSTLQTNIDNETSSRTSADLTLQANINNEANSRSDADTILQNNIDAEALGRTNADTTESNFRSAADIILQNNIDAESLTRSNADISLENNKVDKITGKQLSTEDYTTPEKTKLAGIQASAVSLATVKADTQIASAITDDHTHANKATIDSIVQNDLTSIGIFNALLDLILNGNYNCETAPFDIDAEKLTIDINLR